MAKREMELSPRLRLLADWVRPGARVADVGTDHAYLPVWLVLHGRVSSAIASDLRKGPLQRAWETCRRHGAESVDCRLCDGLSGIGPEEADTVIIAGMGGENIAAILAAAPWTRDGAHTLLLQPMSAQPELRRWLQGHGYTILREVLAREGDTIYTLFLVQAGPMPELSPAELWAGRQSRGEDAPLRRELLDRLIAQTGRAVEGLRKSSRASDGPRLAELEEVHRGLMEMREEWLSWQA